MKAFKGSHTYGAVSQTFPIFYMASVVGDQNHPLVRGFYPNSAEPKLLNSYPLNPVNQLTIYLTPGTLQ